MNNGDKFCLRALYREAESLRAKLDGLLRYTCKGMIERSIATGHADSANQAIDVLLEAYDEKCAQLAEYRTAITALDCWMEKHDPKARSDYWRWRHRYHAIVNDARGDHE